MPSILTESESGAPLAIALPDESQVEALAFALAISGCHPDDRADAAAIRAKITDAQRQIARQHMTLYMNMGAL